MPKYDYECPTCGTMEIEHSMNDSVFVCPKCSETGIKKRPCIPGIIFRGQGFYINDSKGEKK